MRLTSVAVDGVGCFGVPTRIEGLGPGVNILSAGNEAGKSTFFKAIRACLFEKHSADNPTVRELATEGLKLPAKITLGFNHAGASFEITKSFLRSSSASLKREGIEIARDRAADETLWELLGITPRSGRAPVDQAAFGILWVAQGHSFSLPKPTEAGTTVLNTIIQQEVGSLVGGERARLTLDILKDELANLITKEGAPKKNGALGEALHQRTSIAAELHAADGKLADLDRHLDELQKARAERRQRSDPADIARLANDLAQARTALKDGQAAAAVLAQCVTDEELAHALLKSSREKFIGVKERAERIDANRRRCEAFQSDIAPLDERETAARNAIAEASTEIARLDQDAVTGEAAERALQRLSAAVEKAADREAQSLRLSALTAFEDRLARNEAALKANKVPAAAASQLNDIERELGNLTARLDASASRVSVERLGFAGAEIRINGEPVSSGVTRAVIDPVTITVGDVAKITVMPPPQSLADAARQRHDVTARLKSLLDGCGASDGAELRRSRASREPLENEARTLEAEKAVLGLKKQHPAGEIARLRTAVSSAGADIAQVLADLGLGALPGREDIDERRQTLAQSRQERRERQGSLGGLAESQNTILAAAAAERGALEGQQAEIRRQFEADLALLPDDSRAQIIQQAEDAFRRDEAAHRAKVIVAEERRGQTPSTEEIARLANRVTRLEEGVENQRAALGELDRRIAGLEGQIAAAGGDGLGEKVADLRARLDLATRDCGRQTDRVETAKLLQGTIEASYNSRREQLNAPLLRHLLPYLNDVFPSSEITLGDGFTITGIKRPGPGSETFERLSDGTREQIAVLVRLAMGAMICERGEDVPVILDDALVFSDDARIEQMFDALNRAGQKQQVIVLTCRSRTFTGLGGRQLSIARAS